MKILKDEKGQSLVEFTIVLPILLILIMGMIESGMMLNSYITIENASREGARAGIIGNSDNQIKELIIARSPSLDPDNLTISIIPNELNRKSGDSLLVKVTYNYKIIVPIINGVFGNSVLLNGETSMRVE